MLFASTLKGGRDCDEASFPCSSVGTINKIAGIPLRFIPAYELWPHVRMNSAKVFHAGIFWLHTRLDNHKVLK